VSTDRCLWLVNNASVRASAADVCTLTVPVPSLVKGGGGGRH